MSAPIRAEDAHCYFNDKVAGVRSATSDAPPPSFSASPTERRFDLFQPLTSDDIISAVGLLSDKQCQSDPVPTHVLKEKH